MFFGIDETSERVLVGHVYDACPWQEVGWIRKADLLESRRRGLSIGDFNELNERVGVALEVSFSSARGGLVGHEHRLLRVVNQPERGSRLGSRPGDDTKSKLVFDDWRWYYVYDLEVHEGAPWLLVGDTSSIMYDWISEDTRKQEGPRRVLLGWLPAETVSIWASNLVLELNTNPSAVQYRVRFKQPAVVLCVKEGTQGSGGPTAEKRCRRDDGSEEKYAWTEPIDEMWNRRGTEARESYKKVLDIDPRGLDPTVPRLHIVQVWEGDYLEVASSSSTSNERLSLSDIAQLKFDVQQASDDLRKVDIVFVVDSTGSMKDEIDAVKELLVDLAVKLGGHTKGAKLEVEDRKSLV